MKTIKMIKNNQDYQTALARLDTLMEATPGSPEAEELDLLSYLVDKYESEIFPIELPDPIEAIKFRMEQQGLSRKDLIPYIGSQSKVSEVMNKKRPLSLSMIRALHDGLGIPAEVLLQEPGKKLQERRFDPEAYPLKEMFKMGYFSGVESIRKVKEQAEELLEKLFSPLAGLDEIIVYCRSTSFGYMRNMVGMAVANGHADYDISAEGQADSSEQSETQLRELNEKALLAWQARVLHLCAAQGLPRYKKGIVTEDFIRRLVHLSIFPNGPQLAAKVLRDSGIHFVILAHLPRTYLDGACFKKPNGRPVVGMTLRHDRLDNFWFTLIHELAHVLLHLKDNNFVFFDDTEHGLLHNCSQQEQEANDLSAQLLIPQETWEQHQQALASTLDEHLVLELAQELDISPAIIAGRLRWEMDNYAHLNGFLGANTVRKMFPEFNGHQK